jgi:hypothetical protein
MCWESLTAVTRVDATINEMLLMDSNLSQLIPLHKNITNSALDL